MHHFPCVRVPIVSSPPGPHRRLSAPDSVTYLDNVEAFVSPAGGIGLRAARPISADSILMSVDNRWILDADVALADPVMGPILADLEANGEACATDHYCSRLPSPVSSAKGCLYGAPGRGADNLPVPKDQLQDPVFLFSSKTSPFSQHRPTCMYHSHVHAAFAHRIALGDAYPCTHTRTHIWPPTPFSDVGWPRGHHRPLPNVRGPIPEGIDWTSLLVAAVHRHPSSIVPR